VIYGDDASAERTAGRCCCGWRRLATGEGKTTSPRASLSKPPGSTFPTTVAWPDGPLRGGSVPCPRSAQR